MPSNRRDQRQIMSSIAKHTGDMHQGSQLFEIEQCIDGPLVTLPVKRVEQLAITALEQLCHLDRGDHISHGVVRRAMFNTVDGR